LKHNLWKPDTHLIISGFQAHGSLGRKIVEGAPTVKLWGERVKVAAQIHTVGGLSAHADQKGMLDWYESFEGRPPVLLVHGEPDAANELANQLRDKFGARARPARKGKSTNLLDLSNF
jgi:metallo-beta-lactamase family protein